MEKEALRVETCNSQRLDSFGSVDNKQVWVRRIGRAQAGVMYEQCKTLLFEEARSILVR